MDDSRSIIGLVLCSSVRFGWLVAGATIVLGASVATTAAVRHDQRTTPDRAAAQPSSRDTQNASVQAEEELARVGEEMTDRVCSTSCHTLEDITRTRRTARDWNDMVISMANRGAEATDEQFATIRQYLTRYFGRVSVNTASAEELSAVLGLSSKDAKAIVEHRKTHGKFADAASLLKVQGIDKTRIEAQPDALRFN